MYGILLRLDSGRQKRVGTDPLSRLLKPEVYKKIKTIRSNLNASTAVTSPFAPTLIRPSFYPDCFRATDIRTLYWKVRNHNDLHGLKRVYVDENSRVVFEFSELVDSKVEQSLIRVLKACGHFEFVDPKTVSNSVSFALQSDSYSADKAGETVE